MSALNNLLRPFPVGRFLSDYREKRALIVRGDDNEKFRDLLSMETMDYIISSGYLRHPECKLVLDGREIPVNRYVTGEISLGAIDTDALYSEFLRGATIIVNSAHRYWPPISKFCRELERLFSVPVQANVYLTPKDSQGFSVHYDPHDVFVLQVAGRKRWRLYGSPLILPDEKQLFNSSITKVGRIRQTCTLKTGDLLYIPRGYLHDATAGKDASLHITVGIRGVTWGDLLLEAVKILIRSDSALRTSLPAGFANRDLIAASIQPKLLRLRSKVSSNLPLAGALDEVANNFTSRRRQQLGGQLVDLERCTRLRLDSTVARRPEIFFRRWKQGKRICILFFRKKILFPIFVGPALEFVLGAESFCPRDIPGRLSNRSKLVLCRCLVREGFLKILAE